MTAHRGGSPALPTSPESGEAKHVSEILNPNPRVERCECGHLFGLHASPPIDGKHPCLGVRDANFDWCECEDFEEATDTPGSPWRLD